jgi:hypothetical protein
VGVHELELVLSEKVFRRDNNSTSTIVAETKSAATNSTTFWKNSGIAAQSIPMAHKASFTDGLLIKLNVAENKRPDAGSNIYYTDGGSQYVALRRNVSLNDPVGTVDFGPCLTGSSITLLCLDTGLISYGADMGGCLPVGDLSYFETISPIRLSFMGRKLVRMTISHRFRWI